MTSVPPAPTRLPLHRRALGFLENEPVGGALLLAATVLALVAANSPLADTYAALRDFTVGPEALHLDLSLGAWAADGLLAIFFFVVGLELKREFVAGDLRSPRRAAVPIAAAIGGVVGPALVYVLLNLHADGAVRGWAIPAATDIAFAVAVLAVVGRGLPPALRLFLLTLAVVDDLIAITVIALGYTTDLAPMPLLLALLPLAAFAVAVQRGVHAWWVLLPLAVTTWALVHASGVHATVAGVLLGFTVPVLAKTGGSGEDPVAAGLASRFEHAWAPISTGLAVPVFAFFAAGVTVGGLSGLGAALSDSVAYGIVAGLLVGKAVGITGGAWLVTRLPGFSLAPGLRWPDITGIALLGGIGFTVSLLVGELAFGGGTGRDDVVKVGVLVGSTAAAVLGGTILLLRGRAHAGRR